MQVLQLLPILIIFRQYKSRRLKVSSQSTRDLPRQAFVVILSTIQGYWNGKIQGLFWSCHFVTFCLYLLACKVGKGFYSCGDAEFAVRVCRHTCGYCNDALYDGRNTAPLCAANVMTSLGPNYAFLRNRLQWNTY
ncbi:hypothetical protein COOONC_20532 [Cooperia oncophora]